MQFLRFLLFPFSLFYGLITSIRNILFDLGILSSYKPQVATICVGNLSTGGTGKTPTTEWLINQLKDNYKLAVLSRGYGRKTKGLRYVELGDSARDSGDEPLQIKKKFPEVLVMVAEKRVDGLKKIEKDHSDIQIVILDDAFQHRYVSAQLNVLLSTYSNPYFKDFVLPSGNLREFRNGAKRADIIVITKCPEGLNSSEKEKYLKRISPKPIQKVFFASNEYQKPKLANGKALESYTSCLLVSGIANNKSLISQVESLYEKVEIMKYPDHHEYSENDVKTIVNRFKSSGSDLVLVTEKDWVKLDRFSSLFDDLSVFVLPYGLKVEGENKFLALLEARLFTT